MDVGRHHIFSFISETLKTVHLVDALFCFSNKKKAKPFNYHIAFRAQLSITSTTSTTTTEREHLSSVVRVKRLMSTGHRRTARISGHSVHSRTRIIEIVNL